MPDPNPYESLVDQVETPADSPYDRLLAEEDHGQQNTVRESFHAPAPAPDARAEALTLAGRYKVPVELVERNPDQFRAAAADDDRPYARIVQQTPHLARWLTEQPAAAAAIKDDLEPLGLLEWLVTAPERAWRRGTAQVELGQLRSASITRELTAAETQRIGALKVQMQEGGALGAGDSWFRGAVVAGAEQLPNLFGASLEGARLGIPAGVTAGTGAAMVSAAGGPVGEAIGVGAAFSAGMTSGMLAGGAKFGYELESGLAYDEFLEFHDEAGQRIDPAVAKAAALAAGVLNSGLEAWGLEKLLKTIPGVDKLIGMGTRTAVREALRSPTVRAGLAAAVKGYAGTLTAESSMEVAQRAVTILSGELAKAATNVTTGTTITHRALGDVGADLANEFTGAVQAFALPSAPGHLMHLAADTYRARQAAHNAAFFTALGEGVAQSKTVQRMPDDAQAFLARATKDGPIADLYVPVDAWVTYWQSKGVDPGDMYAQVTGNPAADVEHARSTTADLTIPTAAYAVKLAGTEHNQFFAQELRLGAELPNGREAAAFEKQVASAAAAATAPAGDVAAPLRGLREKLEAGGGFTGSVADKYALLHEQIVGSLADRVGIAPEFSITVGREGLETAAAAAGLASDTSQKSPAPEIPTSVGTPGETSQQARARRVGHLAALASSLTRDAQAQDPTVDPARIRREVEFRVDMLEEQRQIQEESGHDAGDLLRSIAGYGGMWWETRTGGFKGEIEQLLEADSRTGRERGRRKQWGGVEGVFNPEGLTPDGMVEALRQDPRFEWIADINDLLEAVNLATRTGTAAAARGSQLREIPGTVDLAAMGVKPGTRWWEKGGPSEVDATRDAADAPGVGDVDETEPPEGGDTSFEFSQPARPGLAALQDKLKAHRAAVAQELAALGDRDGVALRDWRGDQLIVHASTREPGRWQLTAAAKDGTPHGHTTYDTFADAYRSARGLYGAYGPPAGGREYYSDATQAAATFHGWQETGLEDVPPFALYTIASGRRAGSTVTREELEAEGIAIPDTPAYERTLYQPAIDTDFDALLAAMPDPAVVVLDAQGAAEETNASGESAASLEAQRRLDGMRSRGERFVVVDRAGRTRELLGADAVDYSPRPGESFGIQGPMGFRPLGGEPVRTFYQSAPAVVEGPTFYSRIERAVAASPQAKAAGAQWKATIRNAKGGISTDEFGMVAVDALEDGRTYTRDEVLAHLEANRVEVYPVVFPEEAAIDPDELERKAQELYDRRLEEAEADIRNSSDISAGIPSAEYDEDRDQWEAYLSGASSRRNTHERIGFFDTEAEAIAAAEEELEDREEAIDEEIREHAEADVSWTLAEDDAREELEAESGDRAQFAEWQEEGPKVKGTYAEVLLAAPHGGTPAGYAALTAAQNRELREAMAPEFRQLQDMMRNAGNTTSYLTRAAAAGAMLDLEIAKRRDRLAAFVGTATHDLAVRQIGILEALRESRDFTYQTATAWYDGHGEYEHVDNPIVRIRANVRIAPGGDRVFFIEEIQPPQPENFAKMPPLFQKQWRELGFKWALRAAIDAGAQHLAWTTGQMQADRYSLEKQVDRIEYFPGRQRLSAYKGTRLIVDESNVTPEKLPAFIGKEAAERMLELPLEPAATYSVAPHEYNAAAWQVREDKPGMRTFLRPQYATREEAQAEADERASGTIHRHTLEGADLKIGGEGLRRLYDRDFPAVVNKLPAVKRAGLKAGTIALDLGHREKPRYAGPMPTAADLRDIASTPRYSISTRSAAKRMAEVLEQGTDVDEAFRGRLSDELARALGGELVRGNLLPDQVPGIAIPPALRDDVRGGQPLFQSEPGDGREPTRRGVIRFGNNREFRIDLLRDADLSTFLHETGHLYLEVFGDLIDALNRTRPDPTTLTPMQRKALGDYAAILQFLGVESRDQIATAHHEQFARAFEAYLLEGKAPSLELRNAFASFRVWLTQLYRSVRGLDVELSDEIRRVFDRLAATDDQIAAAEHEARIAPVFTTAEQAGMSPLEFASYLDDVRAASARVREELGARVLADLKREEFAWWKHERDVARTEVSADIHAQPVYRAMSVIRTGAYPDGAPLVEGEDPIPMKLSRASIVAQYGKDMLKRLPLPYLYSVEGGINPDTAAELFGFDSGEAMLEAIAAAPAMTAAIDRAVDARMMEKHGDVLRDGRLEELARRAVEGEHRARIVEAELRALTRGMVRSAIPSAATINAAARARVAAMRIRDIRPGVFLMASRRASQQAFALLAGGGDRAGAVRAKHQELINLALYREARDAKDQVEVMRRRMQSYSSTTARQQWGRAGQSYLDQIDGLLERYELAAVTQKARGRRASLREWAEAVQADTGLAVDIPRSLLDAANRVNYQDATYEELTGVHDAIEHIAHLARLKNALLAAAQKRTFDDARDAFVASIFDHNDKRTMPPETDRAADRRRSVGDWYASHAKIATLAHMLDGHADGGEAWELLIRPLNAAADVEATRKAEAGSRIAALVDKAYPGRTVHTLETKRFIPAIGASLSKEGILAVALNWGNEGNRARITTDPTRNWNAAQIAAILDTLDRRDWEFVQGVWDYIDSFWPEIAEKQRRVTGLAPPKVERAEVETKYGTFPGGYYPIASDPRRMARAGNFLRANASELVTQANYVRSTTARGHTEARVEHAKTAVRLDLGVIGQHVDQVIHDLTHHEVLVDVNRVLRDDDVAAAIYATRGDQVYNQFRAALQDIAIGAAPAANVLERSANFLRHGTQIALLGFNFWTAVQQPLGIFNGAERVGVKWVARGLKRWMRDAVSLENTVTWINTQSPFMHERATNATQDLAEVRARLTESGGWFDQLVRTVSADTVTQQRIVDSYLWHIGIAQRFADVPTWLGAYEKAMAGGNEEARAIALADQAVRDSQGSGQIHDLAAVQRGSPIAKLFMTFYSYGNVILNRTMAAADRAEFRSVGGVAGFVGSLSALYLLPAVGTVALAHALGRKPAGDDAGEWFRELASELLGTALNSVVLVRELGAAVQMATGLEGGARGYAGPGGLRPVQLVYRLAQEVNQGQADRGSVRAANEVAGTIFRYPSAQVQRTIDGWVALQEGRTSNPAALLVGAPREAP